MSDSIAQRRQAFFQPAAAARLGAPDRLHINGDSHTPNRGGLRSPRSPSPVSPTVPSMNGDKKSITSSVQELHGTVGFANIPNQVFRKAVKEGFEFTLMVVGQSGLGKSTFLNSLFLTDFYDGAASQTRKTTAAGKTLQINETTVRLVENGVSLTLTLVDTPGFGDAVDNSDCWEPIIQFIDRKCSEYFTEETRIYRKEVIPDTRAHCCLYFIAPTGHGLKPLDIEFMRQLHDRVNIIPVIAKADTMMPDECAAFKKSIMDEISKSQIRIYEFPEADDPEDLDEQRKLKARVPFAVVGSNLVHNVNGKKVRCRKYPWGIVEVDNLEHNDFIALRNMIIRSHMVDLIDVTRFVHYENFRYRQLSGIGGATDSNKDPFTRMEEEKRDYEQRVKQEDTKREQVFQEKLAEKEEKLKQMEKDIERSGEQYRIALEQRRQQIDHKRSQFMQERLSFKQQHPDFQKYVSSNSLSEDEKKKTNTISSVFRSKKSEHN